MTIIGGGTLCIVPEWQTSRLALVEATFFASPSSTWCLQFSEYPPTSQFFRFISMGVSWPNVSRRGGATVAPRTWRRCVPTASRPGLARRCTVGPGAVAGCRCSRRSSSCGVWTHTDDARHDKDAHTPNVASDNTQADRTLFGRSRRRRGHAKPGSARRT